MDRPWTLADGGLLGNMPLVVRFLAVLGASSGVLGFPWRAIDETQIENR